MKAKKKESNGTEDIKDAEESKDENEAEGGHEGSSEAVAKVDDEKAQGDHGSKSGDKSEKPDEKTNGIPGKEAKKSKGKTWQRELSRACGRHVFSCRETQLSTMISDES